MDGSEWAPVTKTVLETARGENPDHVPSVGWFRTRKGRGYLKYDNKSHGSPHAMNSDLFWELRKVFMAKYGMEYTGVDEAAPSDPAGVLEQGAENLRRAAGVLASHPKVVDAISNRLVELADQVPSEIGGVSVRGRGAEVFTDPRLTDFRNYPAAIYRKPGERQANRTAFGAWSSWVNAMALQDYGRPLFIAASADLADSTNLSGFGKDFGDMPGSGWYQRDTNPDGALLPTEITEFTNAGMIVGLATVNLATDPFNAFTGFWGACSTYGSFSYLKYGEMRLFSQLAQDCELKVGKVLWVAGHSGPETAEDSRTHFGIYEPGVTQLFPEGKVVDLHPWEYNEVPVVLAAALATDIPIIALHLTRPAIELPDRDALGMPSHFEAARGAYVLRPFRADLRAMGTVVVQGTTTTANLVKLLPDLDKLGLNVKIVAAISPQLFRLQSVLVPRQRARRRRPARCDGDHQPHGQADARLGRRTARRRVFDGSGLGRPLADGRIGRRGHGRGAPDNGVHPRRDHPFRPRPRQPAPAPARSRQGVRSHQRLTGGAAGSPPQSTPTITLPSTDRAAAPRYPSGAVCEVRTASRWHVPANPPRSPPPRRNDRSRRPRRW
jgi:transketolase